MKPFYDYALFVGGPLHNELKTTFFIAQTGYILIVTVRKSSKYV